MDEQNYMTAFAIIAEAGDSKAQSMEAIRCAKEGRFDEAEEHLKNAQEKMNEVHNTQTELFTEEANGNPTDVNVILVHAQDHLTMCIMAYDNAQIVMELYKEIYEMKKNNEKRGC